MRFYEFSLSRVSSLGELRLALAQGCRVDVSAVGTHQEVIGQLAGPGPFKVGLKVVEDNGPFPLFLTIVLRQRVEGEVLLRMAYCLAEGVGGSVALPEPWDQSEGRFVVVTAERQVFRARGTSRFPLHVELEGPTVELEEVLEGHLSGATS